MTAWVVEDGSQVTGSNTYVSTADAIAYALARGTVIASGDIDVYMTSAMDYLNTSKWKGYKTTPTTQSLDWPREYVYLDEQDDDSLVADDSIPIQLINGECEAILQIARGYEINGTITKADQVVTEKFAVFEKTYRQNANEAPILKQLNAWLAPLLAGDPTGMRFYVARSYG